MYAYASDEKAGVLTGVFSGVMSEQDYEQSLIEMKRVDQQAAARGRPFVYVCVVDKDVPRPPAIWRKKFADANYNVQSGRFYFVMVTKSMLIRGVYTAVTWITAKREGQHYAVLGEVEQAQHWLQAQHHLECPDLNAMERQARRTLDRAAATQAR